MSWFFRWFRRSSRPQVARGLLIPRADTLPAAAPSRSLALRPVTALVVVGAFFLFVYTEAAEFTQARLSQSASPIIVTTQATPYQQYTLEEGVQERFQDAQYFQAVQAELAANQPVVVSVDLVAEEVQVIRNSDVVLVAPIRAVAEPDSWRNVQSGYFTVDTVQPERYSSLEQVYYTDVVSLSSRVAIHGQSMSNDGRIIEAPSLGVRLAKSDAAAVAALVAPGVPVLVHRSTTANTDQTQRLYPRGPNLPVRSYIAAELATDTTLASHQANAVVPIASLTKLMSALVVAAEYDLEGEVVIDQERYVTTLVPRLSGTYQTSIYDLLQLLLLESSNEAAEVLASVMGRDAFIATMNTYAAEIGLADTTFTDPSGLDDGNRASAADLLTLTRYLHQQYPFILNLTAQEGMVAATRTNDFAGLENFNTIDNVDTFRGGKIGETEAARQTSITVHDVNFGNTIRPIVLIVLGSESRDRDVRQLHQYLLEMYRE